MKKLLALVLLLTLYTSSTAQIDSCGLRISLLTCTPGDELYSTFGHSALRVVDSASGYDLVFNYGTFDFDDPDFYEKFINGKLLYFVSIDSLPYFLYEYEYFKRGVTEQVVDLGCADKKNLVAALFENAKEENKFYRYDFNYDNCTTRLRDMIEQAAGEKMMTKNLLPKPNITFRKLIHTYLEKGGQQWSEFGIDILLGSPLDKIVTNRESMFLPDYMLKAFDSSTLHGKPLVAEKKVLLEHTGPQPKKIIFTPVLVFCILFLTVLFLSIFASRDSLMLKAFDFIFFLLLGLVGILLLYMWFVTDHAMTKDNYNLLWAFPVHIISCFLVLSKKKWVSYYFRFIFFYTLAILLAWFFLPQQFNLAFIPITGIVLVRSSFISKRR